MDHQTILKQWITGARIFTIAHFRTASHYKQKDRRLGLISSLSGVVVTSSLFVSLAKDDGQTWLWVTGIISIIATSITTAYSFLKMEELSEKHYRIATDYGYIRKKLELMQLNDAITPEEMETMNEKIHKLAEIAPSIPQKIFDLAEKDVARKNLDPENLIA